MNDLPNETVSFADVKMILGQDVYHLIRPIEYKCNNKNDPWAVKTQLGWTLSGSLPKSVMKTIKSPLT